MEGDKVVEEDDGIEEEQDEEENVAGDGVVVGAQGGQQGVVLGENFFEVEAIPYKRVRKVKSSLPPP